MEGNIVLEACVFTFNEALASEKLGAKRIELCENQAESGTTPSYGTISICKQKLTIPISVMIRPRGGNFVYNNEEFEIIKKDIEICRNLKVDGIVIGFLNEKNEIDLERVKEIVKLSKPDLKVVFHMAFDEAENQFDGLQKLIDLGVDRILTKGGKVKSALEGKDKLKQLIEKANVNYLYKNRKKLKFYLGVE